jgi:hypothetical protein
MESGEDHISVTLHGVRGLHALHVLQQLGAPRLCPPWNNNGTVP